MNGYCRRLAIALLLLLPWGLAWSMPQGAARPAGWAQPVDTRLNLYRMAPGLFRSALPRAQDWPGLAGLGIATVVNFYQHSDSEWLSDPQVRQVHLPMHVDRIDDSDVIAALRSVRQAQQRGGVLIHCKHGQQRTGLIAAAYRMVYQGWSKEQALAEMRAGGFGGETRMGDAEDYLRQVDVAALRTALANGACSTSPWALCALSGRLAGWLDNA